MPADWTQRTAPASQYTRFTPADIEAWQRRGMAGTPGAALPGTLPYGTGAQMPAGKGTLAGGGNPGATTNAAPLPPTPLPPVGATTNTLGGRTFGGQAPTPTPYGDFTAPDPTNFQQDPSYQFRLAEGQKALQRSAMARGTLLSGGFAKRLQDYGQEAASQEYGNAFNRALGVYNTNRDTNAQNYGQLMGQYRGNLDAFGQNTNAALGYGRLDLEAQQANRDAAAQDAAQRNAYQQSLSGYDAMNNAQNQAAVGGMADQYANWVNQQRQAYAQQNAAESARIRGPVAPVTRSPFARQRTIGR